jgi:hypothetical protein
VHYYFANLRRNVHFSHVHVTYRLAGNFCMGVIPYLIQFTELSHMTPSELDEIQCVGSPSGRIPKEFLSSYVASMASQKWLIELSTCTFLLFLSYL